METNRIFFLFFYKWKISNNNTQTHSDIFLKFLFELKKTLKTAAVHLQ